MTNEERFGRMMNCAYNPPGGFLCQMDGYPPFDCEFCEDYISTDEKEAEERMNEAKGVRIYIPADELWWFYIQNKKRCQEELILIAENINTGYAIYLTDDRGTPMFSVCKGNDSPEYEEYIVDSNDCVETANNLIQRYLVPFTVIDGKAAVSEDAADAPGDESGSVLSKQDMEDEIYEREDELDFAIKDFLAAVLMEKNGDAVAAEYGKDFVSAVLHHILEYLTDEHGIEIYRPMFLWDDDAGGQVYYEHPYEEYTFDDADATDRDDVMFPA